MVERGKLVMRGDDYIDFGDAGADETDVDTARPSVAGSEYAWDSRRSSRRGSRDFEMRPDARRQESGRSGFSAWQ